MKTAKEKEKRCIISIEIDFIIKQLQEFVNSKSTTEKEFRYQKGKSENHRPANGGLGILLL